MSSATRIIGSVPHPSRNTRGKVLRALHKAFKKEGLLMTWYPGIPFLLEETESESGLGKLTEPGIGLREFTSFFLYLEMKEFELKIMLDMGLQHAPLLKKVGERISDYNELTWGVLKFTENENSDDPLWVDLLI